MSAGTNQFLLLAGSAEHPSHARANLEAIANLLRAQGADIYLWDLFEDPLPIFNPAYHNVRHLNESEAMHRLIQLANEADGFVWVSPNYHNSFSGVLKNALDSLTSAQFRNKPVALMSTGHSDRTAVQPCDQLHIVARGLMAVAIPTQVVTIASDFIFSQDRYVLINSSIHKRLVRMVDELISYADLMRQLRTGGPISHAETNESASPDAMVTPGSAHVNIVQSYIERPNPFPQRHIR